MHGLMEAQHDKRFKEVLNSADLVVPDGMPLVWLGRLRGHYLERRVYGPELMQTFCSVSGPKYRHYFYGTSRGWRVFLSRNLARTYGINVVGECSPPFRPLSQQEDDEITELINAATPDVLWIGLSTPKQERWMYEHKCKLEAPIVIGVGAAFDFHAGSLRQAPVWIPNMAWSGAFALSRNLEDYGDAIWFMVHSLFGGLC